MVYYNMLGFMLIIIEDLSQCLALFLALSISACVGTLLYARNQMLTACVLTHSMVLIYAILASIGFYLEWFVYDGIVKFGMLPSAIVSFTIFIILMSVSSFAHNWTSWDEDSFSAGIMSISFAAGLLILEFFTSSATHIGIEILSGNIDEIELWDLALLCVVLVVNVLLFLLLYKEYTYSYIDESSLYVFVFRQLFFEAMFFMHCALSFFMLFQTIGMVSTMCYIVCVPMIARPFSTMLIDFLTNSILIALFLSLITALLARIYLFFNLNYSTVGVSSLLICITLMSANLIKSHKNKTN